MALTYVRRFAFLVFRLLSPRTTVSLMAFPLELSPPHARQTDDPASQLAPQRAHYTLAFLLLLFFLLLLLLLLSPSSFFLMAGRAKASLAPPAVAFHRP